MENELTLLARVAGLEKQNGELVKELSEVKGAVNQLNQSVAQGNRLTLWQFIAFVGVMAGSLFASVVTVTMPLKDLVNQTREYMRTQTTQIREEMREQNKNIQEEIRLLRAEITNLRQELLRPRNAKDSSRRAATVVREAKVIFYHRPSPRMRTIVSAKTLRRTGSGV
jgi:peptidoglycan hydrolase CwlO-like protein